ncbi:MAG TPA: LysR family transcriptional regulator [Afipia sp.]
MNTHDLLAFVAVVDTGSIVAASGRLNLTQPAVTRRVQNLETLLGAELLDRTSKPLRPTVAGREAYEHGRSVLRALDDMTAGIAGDGAIRGEFRLGITPYVSESGFSGPIDLVRKEFPAVGLRVVSGWSPEQTSRVSRNQLDAAAVCLPDGMLPPENLVGRDLGIYPVIFVVSRDTKISGTVSLQDLSRLSWVINPDGCGFRVALKHRFDAAHLPFSIAVDVLDAEFRLSLVARGLGIGIVTPIALRQSPLRNQLKTVKVQEFNPSVRVWVVHQPSPGRLAKPIKVFGDALHRELRSVANR